MALEEGSREVIAWVDEFSDFIVNFLFSPFRHVVEAEKVGEDR